MFGILDSLFEEARKIRQIIVGFIVFFLLILVLTAPAAAANPQKFLLLESYPWAFYDKDRTKGAAVEWLAALSEKYDLALAPVITSFQRGMDHVKRGEIDFMIAPDTPRFRAMGTSVLPVLVVPMVLVARPGLVLTDAAIPKTFNSLGIISGLLLDEIAEPAAALPSAEDVQTDSGLRRMAAGRLDGMIVSKFALMAEAARQDLPVHRWPQRPFGTLQLALFIGPNAATHPQTEAVVRAVRQARDARAYLPYMARYLSP